VGEVDVPVAEPAQAPLRSRVVSGSVWTIASYGGSQVLRLLGNLVFAKLLFPEAFGMLALVSAFVQGLTMFSDIGIGPSIIQNPRGEDQVFLDTAWTIQIVRGVVLWLVSVACAAPFAAWYGEPQLAQLIPVAALAAVISGFNSTRLFTAGRRIALARVTLLDFIGQTLGMITMITWCVISPSIWAIVIGNLVGTAAKTLLSFTMLEGERNRLRFDRGAASEMTRFGRWVFISTSLTFLALQVDKLMLGKLVPMGMLGIYNNAMSLASLTPAVGTTLASSVLFPLLAHHSRTDSGEFERDLRRARALILEGALFILAGLALVSPAFFHILYDDRYREAAWMAQLMTVSMWIWMLVISADRAVLALGESRTLAMSNAATLLCKTATCFAGFHYFGLPGFILGLAPGNLAGHVPIVLSLRRRGIHIVSQDLAYTAVGLLVIGGGVLVQRLAEANMGKAGRNAVELTVAVAVLVPLGLRAYRSARQTLMNK